MTNIVLYTGHYPYTMTTESFLESELSVASNIDDVNVTIVPVNSDSYVRPLPPNVSLSNTVANASWLNKLRAFLMVFAPSRLYRVAREVKSITKISYIADLLKYLYAANMVYIDVCRRAKSMNPIVFYSYWLSYSPVGFAFYKQKYPNTKHVFVSRGHGGDVYTTDRGLYYPLREFLYSNIDKVCVVSNYGRDYLRHKYPLQKEKIQTSYLGVMPNKPHCLEHKAGVVRFVSCSSVYDFKRVDLLFEMLSRYVKYYPMQSFEWTHYGGGPLFESLQNKINVEGSPSNLQVKLKGPLKNADILNGYRVNGYTCFVHLSTTEGLPVSMMEALASNIPIVACNVGGVSEIVTDKTGILLEVNFSITDFKEALDSVLQNNSNLQVSINDFFDENFNAINNYSKFYSDIKRI